MSQEQVTETTSTDKGADVVAAPEAAPAAPAKSDAAVEAAQLTPENIAQTQFQPSWKYTFDGQEKELEEFWRPLVKDKDSNQKVIEAIQQLEAFPKWKQKATEYEETVKAVEQLSSLFQKGDHERVLEVLGYKDDMLFDLVKAKLDRQKLPPEQRAEWEAKRQLQVQNEKLLAENQKFQMDAERELARRTDFELDMELGKAEYKKLKDAYDGAYGSGAFKKKVMATGEAMVGSLGRHVPPAELMQSVVRDYAPFLNQPSAPVVEAPKVIPQVSGGSGTPGKKAVTSLEDIKKLRKQMSQDD